MPLNISKRAIIRTTLAIHTTNGTTATIHTYHQRQAVIGRVLDSLVQQQALSINLLVGGE